MTEAVGEARSRAEALKERARFHKRASAYHRKAARAAMEELDSLCRRAGIALEFKGEGDTHGRDETDA